MDTQGREVQAMDMTATTEARERIAVKNKGAGFGGSRPNGNGGRRGPNGGDDSGGAGYEGAQFRIGAWVLVAAVLMFFVAFTSAYMFRASMRDFVVLELPHVLWLSTALILTSSVTFEVARRAQRRGDDAIYRLWLAVSLALGCGFLVSQLLAWRQLVAQGVYFPTNPFSSFFYLLTGLHGIHLLGGIIGLCYLLWRALRDARELRELRAATMKKRRALTGAVGLYWHFMDGLWVYLFALLLFWR